MTIDTAGSNFDTVLAVYTWDGIIFTEVACSDDYPPGEFRTLQSQVTFDAAAGTTYYIQAGGFDGEMFGFAPEVGRLRLSIN